MSSAWNAEKFIEGVANVHAFMQKGQLFVNEKN